MGLESPRMIRRDDFIILLRLSAPMRRSTDLGVRKSGSASLRGMDPGWRLRFNFATSLEEAKVNSDPGSMRRRIKVEAPFGEIAKALQVARSTEAREQDEREE
ncbi:hypothetical protein M0802_015324 [Mischocyttarus mexicanus]|nr:hypothetical protein M0802_015324 [Mischocyttarus mexicanus]